jgi:hypothetical protein
MLKYKLLITTLPFVAIVVGLALLRDFVFQIHGLLEFGEIAPILSAVALIIGFMMAGVLADYKESEKIPGEIATTMETIGDNVQIVVALSKDADTSSIKSQYARLVATVDDWFMCRISVDQCYAVLEDFLHEITIMHQVVGANYAIRSLAELHNLRRLITRVTVISKTSFIPAVHILLNLMVVTTVSLLLIVNYKTVMAEYFLITLLSLIYIYLLRLIGDVDNPFEYSTGNKSSGSTEVDPFPMQGYRKRFVSKNN